jgi:hypothetical protein
LTAVITYPAKKIKIFIVKNEFVFNWLGLTAAKNIAIIKDIVLTKKQKKYQSLLSLSG